MNGFPKYRFANSFLVGCDPEFIVLDAGGKTVELSGVLPHDGPLGYDHGGRLAEVRPEPAKGTWTLVRRIQRIVTGSPEVAALRRLGRWRAGGQVNGDSLGGHIHIDLPYAPNTGVTRQDEIAALDAVFKVLEDLEILPGQEMTQRRRSNHGYGRWGSVRASNDGKRFEYRAAPSWLFSPKVAFLCLTAAKLACVDPKGTASHFKLGKDWKDVEGWLRGYSGKDSNARRLVEGLGGPIRGDVEADVYEVWRGWK